MHDHQSNRSHHPLIAAATLAMAVLGSALASAEAEPVVLQNRHLRYAIATNGVNLEFIDRATGSNYLRGDAPSVCAWVRASGANHPASSVSLKDDLLTIGFGSSGVKAILRTEPRDSHICVSVESVTGADVDSLVFLN